ncbi:fatty acid hydroxylase superfamily-domain-containing protein [Chytriomyces sp. MP71]|nr:fatty acid hydroxylase superfamily-domain-containing protein [Chytriomyces sp. MP71]
MGTFLFAWHHLIFFSAYLPYFLFNKFKLFEQYKLQPGKEPSPTLWWSCFWHMVREQCLLHFPLMVSFRGSVAEMGMRWTLPLPSWSEIIPALLFCLVVEDFFAYWLHRALHWGPLYKYIHKVHHTYTAPFGLVAEYGHPAETLLLGIGFTTGPLLWSKYVGMHVFTMILWVAVRLLTTMETHCGYDMPWGLNNLIPFWGGAPFHDHHHRVFNGNYGGSFRFWDWAMGTDKRFREEARIKSSKVSKLEKEE